MISKHLIVKRKVNRFSLMFALVLSLVSMIQLLQVVDKVTQQQQSKILSEEDENCE